jgi:hypothetical protein
MTAQPDDNTVAAYLANRLSAPEAEAFEEYCLEHPEFARAIELDIAIKAGLRELSLAPNRQVRRGWLPLAIAATLLLAVLGIWWRHSVFTTGQRGLLLVTDVSGLPVPLRTQVVSGGSLIRLRQPQIPTLIANSGPFELQVRPDIRPGLRGYQGRVQVQSPSGALDKAFEISHPNPDGSFTLYLDAAQLIGNRISVSVWPSDEPTDVQRFQARVVSGRASTP